MAKIKNRRKRDMLAAVVSVGLLLAAVHDVYHERYWEALVDGALALLLIYGPSYSGGKL